MAKGFPLTGCGGGNSSLDGLSPVNSVPTSSSTSIISVGKADYHEIYDLKPATTYYWKIIAQAVSNPSMRYESPTNSFTTSAY
jgi:hypothetical protein